MSSLLAKLASEKQRFICAPSVVCVPRKRKKNHKLATICQKCKLSLRHYTKTTPRIGKKRKSRQSAKKKRKVGKKRKPTTKRKKTKGLTKGKKKRTKKGRKIVTTNQQARRSTRTKKPNPRFNF